MNISKKVIIPLITAAAIYPSIAATGQILESNVVRDLEAVPAGEVPALISQLRQETRNMNKFFTRRAQALAQNIYTERGLTFEQEREIGELCGEALVKYIKTRVYSDPKDAQPVNNDMLECDVVLTDAYDPLLNQERTVEYINYSSKNPIFNEIAKNHTDAQMQAFYFTIPWLEDKNCSPAILGEVKKTGTFNPVVNDSCAETRYLLNQYITQPVQVAKNY